MTRHDTNPRLPLPLLYLGSGHAGHYGMEGCGSMVTGITATQLNPCPAQLIPKWETAASC